MIKLPFNELEQAQTKKDLIALILKEKKEWKELVNKSEQQLDIISEDTLHEVIAMMRYYASSAEGKYQQICEKENKSNINNEKSSFNVNKIKWITFEESGYFAPYERFEIEICDDVLMVSKYCSKLFEALCDTYILKGKNDFLSVLNDLHIEGWKPYYYKPILDGVQWSMSLYFEDEIISYSGSNAYPKNFNKFLKAIKK
jgi:hypothetical protein